MLFSCFTEINISYQKRRSARIFEKATAAWGIRFRFLIKDFLIRQCWLAEIALHNALKQTRSKKNMIVLLEFSRWVVKNKFPADNYGY